MASEKITTVSEFTHPNSEATIALVGQYHHAGEYYVQTIKQTLVNYEARGSLIHYEGVGTPSENDLSNSSDEVLKCLENISKLLTSQDNRAEKLGRTSLLSEMPFTSSWENHDATVVQIASTINERFNQKLALDMLASGSGRYIPRSMALRALLPTLLDYRNNVALTAVDRVLEQSPNQDIALLWGERHIPGLAKGLKRRGFRGRHIATHYPYGIPHTEKMLG